MGASNVLAAYTLYAGRVPPLSMQLLTYMAVVSKDNHLRPWYGQGHAALAEHALGRHTPIERADIKAVERAITPLLEVKAIAADRHASVRRDGSHTARYRLNLRLTARRCDAAAELSDEDLATDDAADELSPPPESGPISAAEPDSRPPESGGDSSATVGSRPPESGPDVPRNPGSRPPETGTTSPEFRGTEEPGGTTKSKNTEEEGVDLRTAVTLAREPGRDHKPPTMTMPARCVHGLASRLRHDGKPSCALCRRSVPPDRESSEVLGEGDGDPDQAKGSAACLQPAATVAESRPVDAA